MNAHIIWKFFKKTSEISGFIFAYWCRQRKNRILNDFQSKFIFISSIIKIDSISNLWNHKKSLNNNVNFTEKSSMRWNEKKRPERILFQLKIVLKQFRLHSERFLENWGIFITTFGSFRMKLRDFLWNFHFHLLFFFSSVFSKMSEFVTFHSKKFHHFKKRRIFVFD